MADKIVVDIVIPTYCNNTLLQHCISSILEITKFSPATPWFRIIVVNNGEAETEGEIERLVENHPLVTVINTGENLGWEGGLLRGLEQSQAKYVLFMNDDTHVVPGTKMWLSHMVEIMEKDETVGAVGPSSNFVMGNQYIQARLGMSPHTVGLLIGFCMLVRRSALDKVGGVARGLPGGDDLDLSIRLLAAGYKLIAHRGVYVHHWGCQTGAKVRGDWNSEQMIEDTNNELIRRNELRPYLRSRNMKATPYEK